LLTLVKAQNVRIAELEAKCGGPPRTPDNSLLPPSRWQKANAEPPTGTRAAPASRASWPRIPTRCGASTPSIVRAALLSKDGREFAKEYDHIDIPGPSRPVTTRIELFRAACPCCKAQVMARAPADMPEGTPFGPGTTSMIAYLHGCQMIGYKRLTEVCQGLFGLTISQGAIANVLARAGEAFAAPAERIAGRGARQRDDRE
jgi:transposase